MKTVEVVPGVVVTPRGVSRVAGTRVLTSAIFHAFIVNSDSIGMIRRRYHSLLPWQIEAAIRWEVKTPDAMLRLIEQARARR